MSDSALDEIVKDCTVAEQHPCTRGHFPGHPVVPGAFLIARVEALVRASEPGRRLTSIRKTKFVRPLVPGESARLYYRKSASGQIRFRIESAAGTVLEGSGILA